MKFWLLPLLLCPMLARAQRMEWDLAYAKNIPDSLTRPIHMPERDDNPNLNKEGINTINRKFSTSTLIIRSDSLYKQFFWRYIYTHDSLKACKAAGCDPWWYNWMQKHHVDSLPAIDFSKNELVLYAACAQCLAICNHNDTDRGPCHRNACHFRESWFIRKKKI